LIAASIEAPTFGAGHDPPLDDGTHAERGEEMQREGSLTLLSENRDGNSFNLSVRWETGSGLIVSGHDLGPITVLLNDRGDYEYGYVIATERIPELLALLGEAADADVLTVLTRWTGAKAREFERLNRDLRSEFWCW
jgi:hypothetical protein